MKSCCFTFIITQRTAEHVDSVCVCVSVGIYVSKYVCVCDQVYVVRVCVYVVRCGYVLAWVHVHVCVFENM